MKKTFLHFACALLFFIPLLSLSAQKYERERGIKPSEVPANALLFIQQALPDAKDVDWYEETSQEGRSFEAKIEWKDKEYSIEFDSTGKILDVEVEFDFEDIPASEKTLLSSSLSTIFTNYEVEKSQRQYQDTSDNLLNYLLNNIQLRPRFELVVAGVKNGERGLYQVLLEDTGKVVEILLIIPAKTSHLDF